MFQTWKSTALTFLMSGFTLLRYLDSLSAEIAFKIFEQIQSSLSGVLRPGLCEHSEFWGFRMVVMVHIQYIFLLIRSRMANDNLTLHFCREASVEC